MIQSREACCTSRQGRLKEHVLNKSISAEKKSLKGLTVTFSKSTVSVKPPWSRKSFLNIPPCIIHGLAAAVGLLVCHGLFTEPLVNPLAVNSGVPRLIYKQLHRHMNPFINIITPRQQQQQLGFLTWLWPGSRCNTCQHGWQANSKENGHKSAKTGDSSLNVNFKALAFCQSVCKHPSSWCM